MIFNFSVYFDRKKPIPFQELRMLTLLALKYRVDHVVNEAIGRLEAVFPVAFQLDRLDDEFYCGTLPGLPVNGMDVGHCIRVAHLARAIDAQKPPGFIVMALYHCCQLAVTSLTEGAPTNRLTDADFRLCMAAVGELLDCNTDVKKCVTDTWRNPMCVCSDCAEAKEQLLVRWTRAGVLASTAPLDSIAHLTRGENHPFRQLCESCQSLLEATFDRERQVVFNRLGKLFGVERWPIAA